jgi:hypothetical protein
VSGVEVVTWLDVYDTLVIFAFVGLVVFGLVGGWSRYIDWREHRAAMKRYRLSPAFRDFEDEMRKVQRTIGTAMIGPASRMADQLGALARSFEKAFPARPGTVQNPRTDATTPRELSRP